MAYTPEPNDRPPLMVIATVAVVASAGAAILWAVTSLVFLIPG